MTSDVSFSVWDSSKVVCYLLEERADLIQMEIYFPLNIPRLFSPQCLSESFVRGENIAVCLVQKLNIDLQNKVQNVQECDARKAK